MNIIKTWFPQNIMQYLSQTRNALIELDITEHQMIPGATFCKEFRHSKGSPGLRYVKVFHSRCIISGACDPLANFSKTHSCNTDAPVPIVRLFPVMFGTSRIASSLRHRLRVRIVTLSAHQVISRFKFLFETVSVTACLWYAAHCADRRRRSGLQAAIALR